MDKKIIIPVDLFMRKTTELIDQINEKTEGRVFFEKGRRRVRANSMFGVLSLKARGGEDVKLICDVEEDIAKVEEILASLGESEEEAKTETLETTESEEVIDNDGVLAE